MTERERLKQGSAAGPLANVNGEMMPLDEVRISPLDRGFLFGDAVYEVLRVYGGRAWLCDEHFQRLAHSLEAIRLTGVDVGRLRDRALQTLDRSGVEEGIIYIQVTRGSAPRSHPFPKDAVPLELLYVQTFEDPYQEAREKGACVISRPDIRWDRCDIKSTNLLANILTNQEAREAGCREALFYLPDGTFTEGTHTNLFGVRQGRLVTAPKNNEILPGITRGFVVGLAARAGVAVEEHKLHRERLGEVSELFVSGTTSEILPVVAVDGTPVGDGQPGPITRRLQAEYVEAVRAFRAGASPG
jgi:D-alanine transaminase